MRSRPKFPQFDAVADDGDDYDECHKDDDLIYHKGRNTFISGSFPGIDPALAGCVPRDAAGLLQMSLESQPGQVMHICKAAIGKVGIGWRDIPEGSAFRCGIPHSGGRWQVQ